MEEAFYLDHAPMTEKEARLLSPLRLAYVGDAVHELFVRTGLLFAGGKAGAMQKAAIRAVNAAGQARALERMRSEFHKHVQLIAASGPDISSTEIRARIAQGCSTDGLLSESVRSYIDRENLYRS